MRSFQEANKLNPGYYGEFAKCSKLSPKEAMVRIKNNEPYVIRFRSYGNYQNKIKIYCHCSRGINIYDRDKLDTR